MNRRSIPRVTRRTPGERLIKLWWVQLPLRVARLFPTLGSGLSDGLYLVHWPIVAAAAPVAATVLGVLLGAVHPEETFTSSSLVMALMIAVGMLSANLGVWTVGGYAIGDFFLHRRALFGLGPLESLLQVRAPLLLSYFLLALSVVVVPLILASIRLRVRQLRLPVWPLRVLEVLICIALSAALVYLWAIATALLIRPIYTWRGDQPITSAILPLQERGWILSATAAVAVIVRLVLEQRARSPRVTIMANILSQALQIIARQRMQPTLSWLLRLLAGAAGLTLLMAGMISGWLEAVLVFVFLAFVLWVRDQLRRVSWPWLRVLAHIPVLVRFAVGFALSYFISRAIAGALWNQTQGFQPILFATCLSVAILTLFTATGQPASQRTALPGRPSRHG